MGREYEIGPDPSEPDGGFGAARIIVGSFAVVALIAACVLVGMLAHHHPVLAMLAGIGVVASIIAAVLGWPEKQS